MNDGQYTNLRNYLEEIASTTKKVLTEQQRTNELLANKQAAKTPSTPKVPAEAVGPVTVETVQTIDKPDAHLDAVTQKGKTPAKGKGGKPGGITPNVNWNS